MPGPQVPAELARAAKQLVPGTLIELFVLDASDLFSIATGLPGPIYRFHNGNEQGFNPLVFQGESYYPLPITVKGFEWGTKGQIPRPTLSVGNLSTAGFIGSPISALLRLYDNFYGATLLRKFTLFQFLDGQPGANPAIEVPVEKWKVALKQAETRGAVVFQLGAPHDVQGKKLPGKQILANACRFGYRHPVGCTYAGEAKTDQYGNPIAVLSDAGEWDGATEYHAGAQVYTLVNGVREVYVASENTGAGMHPRFFPAIWIKDVCLKTLTACGLRFPPPLALRTAAWPAILRAPVGST